MTRWSDADRVHMREALELAARAGWRTHPNPQVGALVVKGKRVIGRGYHRKAGGPHAERLALRQAGRGARGATLYVTLEPCCHHGRTPPCTDAVLSAGISRVVASMRDPNPVVGGRGLAILRKANVRVDVGLFGNEARRLNEAFCRRVEHNRPWVILKSAVSLDGKIATASGDSKWISSPESRAHAHTLRDQVDAILVGIGTILIDDPRLTTRLKSGQGRNPARVILDSKLQIPLKAKALNRRTRTDIIIATTARADGRRAQKLIGQGVEVWTLPSEKGKVSLRRLLSRMAERRITTLLVEGGGEVAGSFLSQGLVDRICFYMAPILIGGENAPGPLKGKGAAKLSEAFQIKEVSVKPVGPDFLVEGYVEAGKKDERRGSA